MKSAYSRTARSVWTNRRLGWVLVVMIFPLALLTAGLAAQNVPVGPAPSPRAFLTMAPEFTQEMVGATFVGDVPNQNIAKLLGGIAFAPSVAPAAGNPVLS